MVKEKDADSVLGSEELDYLRSLLDRLGVLELTALRECINAKIGVKVDRAVRSLADKILEK